MHRHTADRRCRLPTRTARLTPPPTSPTHHSSRAGSRRSSASSVPRHRLRSSARRIARAVVDLIGLDHGLVLLRKGENWEPVAVHSAPGAPRVNYSRTVLERVSRGAADVLSRRRPGRLDSEPDRDHRGGRLPGPRPGGRGGDRGGVRGQGEARCDRPPQLKPLHARTRPGSGRGSRRGDRPDQYRGRGRPPPRPVRAVLLP